MSLDLEEAVDNLRAMLRLNPDRFSVMVQRQVQFALLPKLAGGRGELENPMWSLLVLLVDGHEAPIPALDESSWEQLHARATDEAVGNEPTFPTAAKAVAQAFSALREFGHYPPPKSPISSEDTNA